MKTASLVVIRCATPDCEWGFPMPDLGEVAVNVCYSNFIEHYVHFRDPRLLAQFYADHFAGDDDFHSAVQFASSRSAVVWNRIALTHSFRRKGVG